ncbi:MAG: sigma-70 family RNA polymerase sigma factor [Deltaproteobacteria bacterium]|nr:sigma-70 family RNA polymerase sigma factor [Deltaproteobacteria bacterium]
MTLLLEDRGLLAAFRAGRREALEQVYRHYVAEVATFFNHGFTYMSGGSPTVFAGLRTRLELQAAVQEVFVRAFEPRTRAAYDGLRPYRAFLLGVARNVALKELTRQGVAGARAAGVEEAQALAAPPAAAEETLHERHGRELVAAFLALALTDDERLLVRLRFEEDLSQEAAARQAGLTRIQVRRWETKLRARLLRYLKRARYLDEP